MENAIDIEKCPVDVFAEIINPDGSVLARTNNVLMFDWIRTEIKRKRLEGYSIRCENGKKYPIANDGRIGTIDNCPEDSELPGAEWLKTVYELL